ncbi:hypothetical protein INT80_12350 [Gallibacterium anatis]|uniref:Uncharacterized protein n=1 Tax=Gallibacterium anatis TaxID=750 RepID=A0A930UTC9_9PAST|nr:hypothetical protein [Gallibacterium anatis]
MLMVVTKSLWSDGNDTFRVTGTAKDTGIPNKAGAVDEMKYASLYATNAKNRYGLLVMIKYPLMECLPAHNKVE